MAKQKGLAKILNFKSLTALLRALTDQS